MTDKVMALLNPAVLRKLLFTGFDGLLAEPDNVMADALDGGYTERTEGLAALLRDEIADPAGRFLACCALTSWADPVVYATFVKVAAAPGTVVWRGQTNDRFNSQDDTFTHLAEAVGRSRDIADERGTAAERIAAARALIHIADRVQVDRRANDLLYPEIVSACQVDLRASVDHLIARLTADDRTTFDLGLQIALFINALAESHPAWATDSPPPTPASGPYANCPRQAAAAPSG